MNAPTNFKPMLTALNMIYFSLIITMLVFGLVVLYLNQSGTSEIIPDAQFIVIFRYVLVGLVPAGIAAGYFVFKQLISALSPSATLQEKLMKLQTAILIRSACLEVPGLFAAVAALLTRDNSFLLFTGVVIAFFILLRPTIYSICSDLGLSQQERSLLESATPPVK